MIKNLINDWTNAPTLAAALTLLGLDDWKTELATANDAFDTMYLERSNEKAETISAASASKVREKVETQYQIAAQHINANAILNPSPTLTTLINQINALIDKYNAEAIRKGQAQEEEEAL